jgi:hypothetical protein
MSELTKIVITATITVVVKETLAGLFSLTKRKIIAILNKPISPKAHTQLKLFFLPILDSLMGFLFGTGFLWWIVRSAAPLSKGTVVIISFLAIYAAWGLNSLVEFISAFKSTGIESNRILRIRPNELRTRLAIRAFNQE